MSLCVVFFFFFFFKSLSVPGMKVDEYDGNHFSANPDIFKRINALLDHSLDISVPHSLQGQDRKLGKDLFCPSHTSSSTT